VKLCITAEAGFEGCVEDRVALASAVTIKEPLDASSVAEVDHRKTGLLLEETAKATGAKARALGDDGKREVGAVFIDQSGGAFDRGVNVLYGNVARACEHSPCLEKGIAKTSVEESGFICYDGQFSEEIIEAADVLAAEPPTGFHFERVLKQRAREGIDRAAANHATAIDRDPHFKGDRLLDEDMFLGGEQPEQISTLHLISSLTEQVDPDSTSNEVQFEFRVSVAFVSGSQIAISPDLTIEVLGEMQALNHRDKI
jgi:hypothetical protein